MNSYTNQKIAFILGDWSRNIGNAFFQLGGLHVTKQVFPKAEIAIINEQPGYPSYWNRQGGNPSNSFDMVSTIDVDYLILMGPMFRRETSQIWTASLEKLFSQNTRLILLGVAAMTYSPEDIKSYRSFLKRFPPFLLTSRDRDTYELLGDLADFAYDGIDLAFFLPDFYSPVGFSDRLSPFIALNFDKVPEPKIKINDEHITLNSQSTSINRTFNFEGETWHVDFPKLRTQFASKSRYAMFIEGALFGGPKEVDVGKYKIVRTDHRPHPLFAKKTFRSPNVMVNDTPYPYLEIYSQAALTLSNRIHACVAALAYGNEAMLFSSSPRTRMLERVGLSEIKTHPVSYDAGQLQTEKDGLVAFLSQHLS